MSIEAPGFTIVTVPLFCAVTVVFPSCDTRWSNEVGIVGLSIRSL